MTSDAAKPPRTPSKIRTGITAAELASKAVVAATAAPVEPPPPAILFRCGMHIELSPHAWMDRCAKTTPGRNCLCVKLGRRETPTPEQQGRITFGGKS